MAIIRTEESARNYLRQFLHNYLSSSGLNPEMQYFTIKLLHGKGKIYNEAESHFNWGEFSFYIGQLIGYEKNLAHQIGIAAGVELLVLASDIIDDLADGDYKGDIHKILGQSKALILANALLTESVSLLLTYSSVPPGKQLLNVINNLRNACNGQWSDLSFIIGETIPTEEDYFKLIDQKSVSFVRLIFGLYQADQDPILEELATYIGFSGQLQNDVKDILSDESNDLIYKKATLPLIKAIEYSVEKDQGWLLRKIKKLDPDLANQKLLDEIRSYIRSTGAIDYCLVLAKLYNNRAKQILTQNFPFKREYVEIIVNQLD
ncbi:class 1 isoprenoid biosynthesis enzyme [Caldifermentibacillus hisashii]|uniref:Class 1 isoprenoid biosynthesis enzyme n=1 Tax=Caldifermentibacillus hisashii TaxID=996558 RepID=A0ABU9K278_9BACI